MNSQQTIQTDCGTPRSGALSYDADHFRILERRENSHFWFAARSSVIKAALVCESRNGWKPSDIVELGCGTGYVLGQLARLYPQARLTGVEPFQEAVDIARRKNAGAIVQGELMTWQAPQQYDLVGCFDVLEHIQDDRAAIRQLGHMVKTTGRLAITVPAFPSLLSDFDVAAGHFRRYTAAGLRQLVEDAGLRVAYETHFMSLLYPPLLLHALMNRRRKQPPAGRGNPVEVQLRVLPLVNRLFRILLAPDALAVRRRMRLPFGTSLFLLAKPAAICDTGTEKPSSPGGFSR